MGTIVPSPPQLCGSGPMPNGSIGPTPTQFAAGTNGSITAPVAGIASFNFGQSIGVPAQGVGAQVVVVWVVIATVGTFLSLGPIVGNAVQLATQQTPPGPASGLAWSAYYYAQESPVGSGSLIAACLAFQAANSSWFTFPGSWQVGAFSGWAEAYALASQIIVGLAAYSGTPDPVTLAAFEAMWVLAPASRAYGEP